jgi:tetratricopeptide (TPR) repeat protein
VPRALEVLAGILANDSFATLDEVVETFYEQEDVVQALIEENYRRLDRDARRVIEALAVFRKPVPPLAVDYLLEPFAPGLDVPSIVQRLARTNIVSVDRAAKTVTLHPIDQDYAYSQLPEEDETEAEYTRQALERRAADYYVQLRTPEETWQSIEDLEPQLKEFEHRVRAEDYDDAYKPLDQISSKLSLWGYYLRMVEMHEKLRMQLQNVEYQMFNQHYLGDAYRAVAQFEQAIRLLEKALQLARKIGNRKEMGMLLSCLGSAYRDLGHLNKAIKFYDQALYIAREISDHKSEEWILDTQGSIYRRIGQIGKALQANKQALSIAHRIGDRWGEGSRLGHLGLLYHHLGRVNQALQLYKQSLAIASQIGARLGEEAQLSHMGLAYQDLGKMEQAIQLYKKALAVACDIGDRRGEGIRLSTLGLAYLKLGKTKEAIKYYKQALSIAHEINHPADKSYALLGLARALLATGLVTKAQQLCSQAQRQDMPRTKYWAKLVIGISHLYERDPNCRECFFSVAAHCQDEIENESRMYDPRYALATALVGRAVCDPRWEDESQRPDLLAPALEEYRRALDITAAPGVVQDAIRDLELIQAAGIEGLEPAFELLENAEYEPDVPEDLLDILEHIKSA